MPDEGNEAGRAIEHTWTWTTATRFGVALVVALVIVRALEVLFAPLLLVVAAVVLATALEPLVGLLQRWLPRVAALLAIYLVVFLVIGGLLWLVVPPLSRQAVTLAERAPELLEEARLLGERWNLPVDDVTPRDLVTRGIQQFSDVLASLPLTLAGAMLDALLIVGMSAYLVLSGPAIVGFLLSLVPPEHRERVEDSLSEAGRTMGGYVRGSLIDGLIIATISYIGLLIIGIDFPLVLALLAFVGELVPVVGPIAAAVPAVAIALTEGPLHALVVALFYFALQQLESYLLLPYIMRSQAHVPPLLTLFAITAGAAVAGIFGAVLAIPTLGAALVFTRRIVAPAIRHASEG